MQKAKSLALAAVLLCASAAASAKTQKVSLNIPTMDCATCPITIKAALVKVAGVP